jgi:hypothetical protein
MCAAKRHVCFTPESRHVQCDRPCRLWAKSGHIGVGEIARSLAGNTRRGRYRYSIRPDKIFFSELFWLVFLKMRKKNLLHYELYGTSARGDKKGYWRWAIFAGREEKPLDAGSFYGTLEEAKGHAEDTISSLKQRARKHTTPRSK